MALWTMRVGLNGQFDERPFLDGNLIGLDWQDVGNVEGYDEESALRDDLDEGNSESRMERGSGWSRQAWDFARSMEAGDLVLVCFGTQEVIHVAEITGDYVFNEDVASLRHTRSVKWIKRDLHRGTLHGEVDVPFENATVALVRPDSTEARMRAFLEGKVRGARFPVPPWLPRTLTWLGERLWMYGDLCVVLVLFPVVVGVPVFAVVLPLGIEEWTVASLGFALWLQVLAVGFRLIDEFADKWKGEHLRESSDLRPDLVGVQRALQGHQWLIVPTWLHSPLREALRRISLLIVGVLALVRLAQGEPILRLFA